ncbi:hypothetical protein ACSVDA_04805 [Cytobacillus sp. Hm23]
MGKYTTSSCCGSTKVTTTEKASCCDCPTFISDMQGDTTLTCTDPEFRIFSGDTQGSLSGTISATGNNPAGPADNGACQTATIRIFSNNTEILTQDLIISQNQSFSFCRRNVTEVTASCSGGASIDDRCSISWNFTCSERCITTTPFQTNNTGTL